MAEDKWQRTGGRGDTEETLEFSTTEEIGFSREARVRSHDPAGYLFEN